MVAILLSTGAEDRAMLVYRYEWDGGLWDVTAPSLEDARQEAFDKDHIPFNIMEIPFDYTHAKPKNEEHHRTPPVTFPDPLDPYTQHP